MSEQAWDEGYDTGYDDAIFEQRGLSTDSDADQYPHDNPYRNRDATNIDVAALRAAAEGATPGPWERDGGWSVKAPAPDGWAGPYELVSTKNRNDAAYIAAANPAVVLKLLDRLAAAEGAVARVRGLVWDWEQNVGPFGNDTFGIASAARMLTETLDEETR